MILMEMKSQVPQSVGLPESAGDFIPSSFEFREDVRGWEAVFVSRSGVREIFLTRHLNKGPVVRANPHDPSGAKAFRDLIDLQADLDSTASHWNVFFRPPDLG